MRAVPEDEGVFFVVRVASESVRAGGGDVSTLQCGLCRPHAVFHAGVQLNVVHILSTGAQERNPVYLTLVGISHILKGGVLSCLQRQ